LEAISMGILKSLRRDGRSKPYRVFFATDIHGSERCFRKFLAAAKVYECDALILGGDIAGKAIVPIRRVDDDHVTMFYDGRELTLTSGEAEARAEDLRNAGMYPRVCTDDECDRVSRDGLFREGLFEQIIEEQTRGWCELAAERLTDAVTLVITPGNDDPFVIDDVLRAAPNVACPERELYELGPITLASLGNTNHTPWDTPREYTEEDLAAQIDEMLADAPSNACLVLNFHCPPKGSGLDTAAQLDDELRPVVVGGQISEIAAGSSAVAAAIDQYHPVVGLHGHIHESAGVWRRNGSVCLNPGSDYGSGMLKGALVVFNTDGSYRTHILTTG
jgi:uncharacterized protein